MDIGGVEPTWQECHGRCLHDSLTGWGACMRQNQVIGSWCRPTDSRGSSGSSWNNADDPGRVCATLLGISEHERDAIRIILAAQVRLRLLRMQLTGCLAPDREHLQRLRTIRQRARLITEARDTLLHSAIETEHDTAAAHQQPIDTVLSETFSA
jgi:hypothetical protein